MKNLDQVIAMYKRLHADRKEGDMIEITVSDFAVYGYVRKKEDIATMRESKGVYIK